MKKILFAFVALMAVMTVQAQSICGTWRTVQPIVENGANGAFTAQHLIYTFNPDGTFTLFDEYTQATKPSRTMVLEVAAVIELKGSYSLVGDQLMLNPSMETYETELLSVSQNGRVTNNAKIMSNTRAKLNSNDFKSRFSKFEKNNVKLNGATLEMTHDGKTVNFERLVTIKD